MLCSPERVFIGRKQKCLARTRQLVIKRLYARFTSPSAITTMDVAIDDSVKVVALQYVMNRMHTLGIQQI